MPRPRTPLLVLLIVLLLAGCSSSTEPAPPAVLLEDDFDGENGGVYHLNYTGFAHWEVAAGSVDLVGTPPFDDFLPPGQGLYVDLDGTMLAAGLLRSRATFDLAPGTYQLRFRMAGMPRPDQAPNTVDVAVGDYFRETIMLPSYAPLSDYVRTFRVRARGAARLTFEHLGGDDYGNLIDGVRLERL